MAGQSAGDVYAAATVTTATQQREMESSNYYTFCSTDGKLFEKRSKWRKGVNADEFSNKYPQP